jgi:protein involved in polysaccharide export with SLBB domain
MKNPKRFHVVLWVAVAAVGLGGCARFSDRGTQDEPPTSSGERDKEVSLGFQEAKEGDHLIAPFETIRIVTVGVTNTSGDFKVQATGKVSYPYLGDVTVTNKTCADLEKELKTSLVVQGFLVQPQVIVSVTEYRRRFVSVTGEVNKPGEVVLPGEQEITILDAIGAAGGLNRYAKNQVQLIRRGKVTYYKYSDLKKMDPKKLPKCEPGDSIDVPQSFM